MDQSGVMKTIMNVKNYTAKLKVHHKSFQKTVKGNPIDISSYSDLRFEASASNRISTEYRCYHADTGSSQRQTPPTRNPHHSERRKSIHNSKWTIWKDSQIHNITHQEKCYIHKARVKISAAVDTISI